VSITCQTEITSTFLPTIFISGVTVTPSDVNRPIIAIKKVNPDNRGIAVGNFFMGFRNQITLNIRFSSLSSCVSRFPAAILETLVEIYEIFFTVSYHTYSGKVTKAIVTIINGFEATG